MPDRWCADPRGEEAAAGGGAGGARGLGVGLDLAAAAAAADAWLCEARLAHGREVAARAAARPPALYLYARNSRTEAVLLQVWRTVYLRCDYGYARTLRAANRDARFLIL